MGDLRQDLLLEAISFATRKHLGQLRKDHRTPYAAHPMRVMTILLTKFGVTDPEVLAAAVLHDTIEDTATDYDEIVERFGSRVAGFVSLLTKDKRLPEEDREERYFADLAAAPLEVKLCKLGDTYDNLADSKSLTPDGRRKAVTKAEKLLAAFGPTIPDSFRPVLEKVRERMEQCEA
jgi:guanosine-3',5'-bis(diphosphate) 3'-pyrophosphohydrolase